eukprot:jgi/Bigna1/74765/fgenesh1_pg.30_\
MSEEIKTFTREEVGKHSNEGDMWVIIDGQVFDISDFVDAHPGGRLVLAQEAGKDVTKKYGLFHGPDVMRKYKPRLLVGYIQDSKAAKSALRAATPDAKEAQAK